MAVLFAEECDGTNGDTVSTSNSSFAFVDPGTGCIFDTTRVKEGTSAIKVTNATDTVWMENQFTATTASRYVRLYINPDVQVGANNQFIRFRNVNTNMGGVRLTTTGTLQILNESGTAVATSTNTVTLDEWNRVEVFFSPGATLTVRLYQGNAACDNAVGSYTEEITADPGSLTTYTKVQYGSINAVGMTMWFDAIVEDDTTWVGPLVVGPGFGTPTNFTVVTTGTETADADWDAVTDATDYILEVERWDGGAWAYHGEVVVATNTVELSDVNVGLDPATLYRARIRARQ
jgi:hypothetical protein